MKLREHITLKNGDEAEVIGIGTYFLVLADHSGTYILADGHPLMPSICSGCRNLDEKCSCHIESDYGDS